MPETSFDLLNDRISFSGFDPSLNGPMDMSVAEPGMGIGLESSFVGRAPGIDKSVGGVTIADFDMKDEEGRMKAFLGMSADWEAKNEAEDPQMKIPSPARVIKTAAKSMHSSQLSVSPSVFSMLTISS